MKTKHRPRFFGKNSRGGFTLVELIVVLVILAIMAAFLIPTLTGYIDKARQKQIIIQTRQAVMAAQTLFDEVYGSGLSAPIAKKQEYVLKLPLGKDTTIANQIYDLAELDDEKGAIERVETDETGKISILIWHVFSKDGKNDTCIYDASDSSEPYKITNSTE